MQLVETEEPPCRWSGGLMPRGLIPFLIEIYTDLSPGVILSSTFQGLVSTEMIEIPPKINWVSISSVRWLSLTCGNPTSPAPTTLSSGWVGGGPPSIEINIGMTWSFLLKALVDPPFSRMNGGSSPMNSYETKRNNIRAWYIDKIEIVMRIMMMMATASI